MGRYKVLIIDKDSERLTQYSSLLEHAGYKVEACASQNECLWLTRKFHPDCVILDYAASGFETLDALAQHAPEVAIVVSMEEGEKIHASQLVHRGVKRILQKPFSDDTFLDSIQQGIAEQHFRRQAA